MPDDRSADFPDTDLEWICPECSEELQALEADQKACPDCRARFARRDGIWRFLPAADAARFEPFLRDYQTIRQAEGRGSNDPQFYRSLPFRPFADQDREWRIRAASYQTLIERVVAPAEGEASGPLKVLDLGAGNCWLSHRLATRSHSVAAVDVATNREDGLGCHSFYPHPFAAVEASFDRLPFSAGQFHLAVFNAALHYSTDLSHSVGEALRVLVQSGRVVILDSPLYHDPLSGEMMVQERERFFLKTYGCASNSLDSENYLTHARLEKLQRELGVRWQLIRPWYGWRWAARPWKARLLRRREPASFVLIVGTRSK